uniref:Uncharacterized protein n=1 Tax=Trypanosoma congolense (strain IL3000) TaxID=1068625 RepID=G0UY81_TRYCI|nr:conserved hypothetical protein [Trypanosoma congolense IL3000]
MPLTPYHLQWSEGLIRRVELRMQQVHSYVREFYEQNDYPFTSCEEVAPTRVDTDKGKTAQGGAVEAVGSFLLRTCVHSTPFYETQVQRGVGADLVLAIPEAVCTLKDIQRGSYLKRRHEFLLNLEKFFKKCRKRMNQEVITNDDCTSGSREEKSLQWNVQRVPYGDCWSGDEKYILRFIFFRKKGEALQRELFHIDIHFRPISVTGRIASAAAIRKHPYYSHLVLEDALMTAHLRRLHNLFSNSKSLQHAAVFLNCWAHHVGIMARTSGHPEALSGFHLSAIILRLVEEGVVSPKMSEENVVRSVWVYLSRGLTQTESFGKADSDEADEQTEPTKSLSSEGRDEVAVLRLEGEAMNLLFRTSASFLKNVIKKSAEEAIQHQRSAEVIQKSPFQPLQLRMDVCLVISGLAGYLNEINQAQLEKVGSAVCLRPEGVMRELYSVIQEALGTRATYVTLWRRNADVVNVAVQLSGEAEGRNRVTRGPPLEDTEAVARFNEFWGSDVTSTRQFPDGAIYRCVLWTFSEGDESHTTVHHATTVVRHVLQFALEKHIRKNVRVSALLGTLEGVLAERVGAEWRDAAPLVQKSLFDACRTVEKMVAGISRTSLPCKITSLDIISASERHTAAFPVRPHLALTYTSDDLSSSCFAGITVAPTIEPVHGVLGIDDRNKIPDTIEAITTMKGAICAQLSKVVQQKYGRERRKTGEVGGEMKSKGRRGDGDGESGSTLQRVESEGEEDSNFCIRSSCTANSVDIILKGYLFRLYIAHYREVLLLRALQREAEAATIERKLFWSAQHAKFLRTISFGHCSYATATRLASRWMSAMYLYEFVVPEAVELLVAHAYLGSSPPKTPAGGFLRFLQLLATHDWAVPLVLPYSASSKEEAGAAELVRKMGEQQGMFIATSYAPVESPFTVHTPRPIIVHRLVQLAKAALAVLLDLINQDDPSPHLEAAVFTSSPSAFDFQMALHPCILLQPDRLLTPPVVERANNFECGSTRGSGGASPLFGGMQTTGNQTTSTTGVPPAPRVWRLDELEDSKSHMYINELVEREPAAHVVRTVRAATRDRAMVFYDCLAPCSISVTTITSSAVRQHCQKLHDDILRISRGALMPTALMCLATEEALAPKEKVKAGKSLPSYKGTIEKETIVAAAKADLRRKRPNVDGAKGRLSKRVRQEGKSVEDEAQKRHRSSQRKSLGEKPVQTKPFSGKSAVDKGRTTAKKNVK